MLAALLAAMLMARGSDARLHGIVVDPSGTPIRGAEVVAGDARAETDGSGEFRLPGDAGWVTVKAHGYLPRSRAIAPGDRVLVRLARDAPGTITFAFGGDVMFGRRYFDANEDGDPGGLLDLDSGADDHLALLDGALPALSGADLSAVNLESPLARNPYPDPTKPRPAGFHPAKDYVFAGLPVAAQALQRAGIDVVGIGNNHLYDRLQEGVASTRHALAAAGYQPGHGFFGAGANADEAWVPAIRTVKGQQVAFVGCTSITGDDQPITYVADRTKGGAARCRPDRLERGVSALARRGYVVVAMIHGGYEYGRKPSAQIRSLSDTAIAAGATLVIDHHPHVVGGLRFANGRLTAWTLGNLLFDQTVWPTFESYVVHAAVRDRRVVSAWLEPLRIQGFTPTGVVEDDADWVARGALARSQGPWVADQGSVWLDPGHEAATKQASAPGALAAIAAGCAPDAGRELLWTGDFEAQDVSGGMQAPLWNVEAGDPDRKILQGAGSAGSRGVRLRRSGGDREDLLLTPDHRILVRPGHELRLLLDHRTVTGRPDATLMLSWYNDTRGGSQAQTRVTLPGGSDWATERVDVRVPANAVAVQPFIRLAPPSLSLAELDVDEVRLIDWDEPGCDYVRGGAAVTGRALPSENAEPKLAPVEAHRIGVAPPPPLPPAPKSRSE